MSVVLIIDDMPEVAFALAAVVRSMGIQPVIANSANEARNVLRGKQFDLVILDNHMPDESGLDFLRNFPPPKIDSDRPPVVFYSASEEGRDEGLRLGAVAWVQKADIVHGLIPIIEQYA